MLALIQWHPRLSALWCGVVVAAAVAALVFVYRRLLRRTPPGKARWLLTPKLLALLLLCLALFDPVSAIQKLEAVKGKLLVLVDSSSSMDVADDYRESRATRARRLVEQWHRSLPGEISMDEMEFDTSIHRRGAGAAGSVRGTDLGGCLAALSERADLPSYLGVVLLTDGGDEALETALLPKVPLYLVGVGTDPATWNDLAITDVQAPATAEKDVDFELSADLQARAGHGQGFAQKAMAARVSLEHAAGSNSWENILEQPVELSNWRARVRLPVKSGELGMQRYRVTIQPISGELSLLNNSRVVSVNVEKKALHVLYFTRELGQEFKLLRNELGRDPGISFSGLLRVAADRFTLQGDRVAGDEALAHGLPASKKGLELYDAIIIGSCPAEDCAPQQMQALIEFVEQGGALVFLGGDKAFGRGGYARTSLATLFPWRLSEHEPEPDQGAFAVQVPPMGLGHPVLATVEETLSRTGATLESVNQVAELKPGATALLNARVGARELPAVALQPFGKGKVLALASNTMWKWATQPEPLRSAYGLFWRQAVRYLTGKTDTSGRLAVRWDKDFYRPGELASGEIRFTGIDTDGLRLTASLAAPTRTTPVTLDALPGQGQSWQVKLPFRERGEYAFRLVATRHERLLETYEKTFPLGPRVPEGSRLEINEAFLRQLAERGGGAYVPEADAAHFLERLAVKHARKASVQESSLVEAGPWFALSFVLVLCAEWLLRRRMNLF